MYISSLALTARFYDNIYQVVHFRKIVMPNNLWVKKKTSKGPTTQDSQKSSKSKLTHHVH